MADEMEGCVAATVTVISVHCLCQLSFWMGRILDVRLINDNLVKDDKLISRAFVIFFFFGTIQITVSSFYRKIQRGPKLMFSQYKP